MFRPAGRLALYLPNRSKMPARACGTMRTVFARTANANTTSRTSTMSAAGMVTPLSLSLLPVCCDRAVLLGVQLGDLVHDRHRAADLEDVDLGTRLDDVVVVRPAGPHHPGAAPH